MRRVSVAGFRRPERGPAAARSLNPARRSTDACAPLLSCAALSSWPPHRRRLRGGVPPPVRRQGPRRSWNVPEGDNGHWKVLDGVIDYDARSEAAGDKNLVSKQEFGDFVLKLDWRIKETPYVNPNVPYVLPDGTHAAGHRRQGDQARSARQRLGGLPPRHERARARSTSGAGRSARARSTATGWTRRCPPVRAGVTPRTQADKPVGEWNSSRSR